MNATSSQPLAAQYSRVSSGESPVTFRYRWYVDGALVPEAKDNVLDPRYFRKGAQVAAEIIPTDGRTEGRAYRTQAVTIGNTPPVAVSVDLAPVPAFPGDRITAAPAGEDRDGDTVSFLYQWEVDGKPVPGSNEQEFDTSRLKKKNMVSVVVIPFDGEDRGEPIKSKSLILSNRLPDIASTPPSEFADGKYSYQVTARDPDGDPLSYTLVKAPPGMTIHPSTGLIAWEPKSVTAREEVAVKVSVSDGDGGTAYQEFSLVLELR